MDRFSSSSFECFKSKDISYQLLLIQYLLGKVSNTPNRTAMTISRITATMITPMRTFFRVDHLKSSKREGALKIQRKCYLFFVGIIVSFFVDDILLVDFSSGLEKEGDGVSIYTTKKKGMPIFSEPECVFILPLDN